MGMAPGMPPMMMPGMMPPGGVQMPTMNPNTGPMPTTFRAEMSGIPGAANIMANLATISERLTSSASSSAPEVSAASGVEEVVDAGLTEEEKQAKAEAAKAGFE